MTVTGLKEALRADFEHAQAAHGVSAAMIATAFGKSPTSSWPYQLINAEAPFTLPMVSTWCGLTDGVNLMKWLAGERFIVAEIPEPHKRSHTANTIREFAEFLDASAAAVEDGHVNPDEYKRIEREAMEAVSAIIAELYAIRHRVSLAPKNRKKTLRAAS